MQQRGLTHKSDAEADRLGVYPAASPPFRLKIYFDGMVSYTFFFSLYFTGTGDPHSKQVISNISVFIFVIYRNLFPHSQFTHIVISGSANSSLHPHSSQ